MREIVGDLWVYHDRGAIVAVPTNGATNRAGWAVMGAGCAGSCGGVPAIPAGTAGGEVSA